MYVTMNLMHFQSEIIGHNMKMADYVTLTTHIQVLSPYWMM